MPQTSRVMLIRLSLSALLLQAASVSAQPSLAGSSRSSTNAVDLAGYAVLSFLSTWRTAWLNGSELGDHGRTEMRLRDVHCHWDGSYGPSPSRGHTVPPSIIHEGSRRSMCPNWFPTGERMPDDERLEHDASLLPLWRDRMRIARAVLLDSLATLDRLRPGDNWITGQRVRFLVDQGEHNAAITLARDCKAEKAWCAQLAGFAFDAAGDFKRADSAFDAATALMQPKDRCEWTSASLLLDHDGRSAYDGISCDDRTATNERLWWLATPLYADSINDRRSEEFSRKVLIKLHSALPWDERFDWRKHFGGEAVADLLERYGWPAFSIWGGAEEEQSHASWMTFYDSTRTATIEYPMTRLHLIPDWKAVADPFHAGSDAWQVSMPPLKDDDEPAAQWWPAEHYDRSEGPIVQLTDQTVMLRRDDNILLATASGLPPATNAIDASARPYLVRTTGPHQVEKLPHQIFRNDDAIVMTARIPTEPAIVGSEFVAAKHGATSARTRMGVTPPAPLSALHDGETAVSEPVFVAATEALPRDPDAALSHMLGALRVRGPKVALYWETYGYAPGDSVDVSVTITRHEQLSVMRRLGMKLRVAHDINGSVAVRWQEPQAGHDSWLIPAVVPIQARCIRLDLGNVEPGHYIVQVAVARRGGLPVTASREFVLEGR